ncbi:hypothetical protein [Paracoccus aminophilus]|uniref:Uncharacterized protein n=1 Tax=Paracoccus aminophilus JCM 7686 TaxID=1367847 RepID=S5XLB6_PARAH|nr:hypothetical protein [Paracoccus aminophilus]AGT07999.1 hypothetical protein JCM7686_0890 [Paracoccus aminophilus JCM 7686]
MTMIVISPLLLLLARFFCRDLLVRRLLMVMALLMVGLMLLVLAIGFGLIGYCGPLVDAFTLNCTDPTGGGVATVVILLLLGTGMLPLITLLTLAVAAVIEIRARRQAPPGAAPTSPGGNKGIDRG